MKKKTRKKYTQEIKEEAVKLITNQSYSFAEAEKRRQPSSQKNQAKVSIH